jgi:hypothetical protein
VVLPSHISYRVHEAEIGVANFGGARASLYKYTHGARSFGSGAISADQLWGAMTEADGVRLVV